jgi:carbon starvation protein CstA
MSSFYVAFVALILGYFFYGKFVENVFGPDPKRVTPAIEKQDGVDFMPLPTWRIFMIQFLNIAGLGPIFGAIMGAKFGAASYLWIVFGCIFAGAVHDYLAGMMSLREGGESLPDIIGRHLGMKAKTVMRIFTVILMVLVGAVFVSGPSGILANIFEGFAKENGELNIFVTGPLFPYLRYPTTWFAIIFIYYILATLLPIDKVIGKVYPLFAIALIFMAVGVLVMLVKTNPALPEIWDGLENTHPAGEDAMPLFPMMFVSIACGAISGFHATQSPLMARCMTNEKHGRPIFYGAMITEGIVALIWAAAANYFFNEHGMEENNAALIVDNITKNWLGQVGSVLALLGVVFAPITSGDTALRSARLIVADFLNKEQKTIKSRLAISLPIFAVTLIVLIYSVSDKEGFNLIWTYFAWCNQALSVFTLWAITVYLRKRGNYWWVTFVPAIFMTMVCSTYIFIAPECLHLDKTISYTAGAVVTIMTVMVFLKNMRSKKDSSDLIVKYICK